MWFVGVEVEQETSAPPPKKNPGSTPGDSAKLLAYCLDYNRETYFFYLVPTNRSFFVIYLDIDIVNNCFL